MRFAALRAVFSGLLLAATPMNATTATAEPRHAIAMHGEPALPEGFAHFPYADPAARKGGVMRLGVQGTFDGLNPLIVKGTTAAQGISPWIVQPLMARSWDEPFTLYPLIASAIDTPADRSEVTFTLDPRARFSDGVPLTSADVAFTWDLLRTRGRPNLRAQLGKVARVETPDAQHIRFVFRQAGDMELPLILGLMPVLAKHATDPETFELTSFRPPVGSGPYAVESVEPGAGIRYRRRPDYWAADLPSQRGSYNADEIRIDYYRDGNSLFEAFKAGLIDYRLETDPLRWAEGYDIPAVRDGRIITEGVRLEAPKGMMGFALNMRRATFGDLRVRQALAMMLDGAWINRNLYGGRLDISRGFFNASTLSSVGISAGEAERAFLARFPGSVPQAVMEGGPAFDRPDGSGRDREVAQAALRKLTAAGWRLGDGLLEDAAGQPFRFEILTDNRADERLALVYAGMLRRIGIQARVRIVDAVQYQQRRNAFDFDAVIATWPVTASPGNEQRIRWSSLAAAAEGALNFPGIRSPAIDAAIDEVLAARSQDEFTRAVRVLDRLLIAGVYVVPLFYAPEKWLAYSARLTHPSRHPKFEIILDTWWLKEDRP